MALWIRDQSSVPPEGWHYPVAQTGYTVRHPNYTGLHGAVKQHCEANGVPVPSEQEVIDWVCANLTVPCVEMETRQPLINRFSLGLPAPVQSCCGGKK